ncbi:helix-turn-helix domain-containing protein [Streptomyces huiliensis]|uniref:helix-turn-helix domain-containing protein n=1 Tax=Streptomyces huiliensis TaxID=2876027 RepID=UPI003558B014
MGVSVRKYGFRDHVSQVGPLQTWLVREKRRAGLSFGELAALTYTSKSSLHRATQGFEMPSRQVFEAFIQGCASDPEAAEQAWRNAELINSLLTFRVPSTYPEDVTSHTELRLALARLVKQRGLTLRKIEKLADQRGAKLRRSTLSDALSGRQNFSRRSTSELVRTCGEAEDSIQAWDEAWQRAERYRRNRNGHLGGIRRLPAGVRHYVDLGIEEIFRVGERYGVPGAEIEMHMRRQTDLRRTPAARTYWVEPPTSWKESVSVPAGDLSGQIEKALREVLTKRGDFPFDWSLLRELTRAVLHELRHYEDAGGTREAETAG